MKLAARFALAISGTGVALLGFQNCGGFKAANSLAQSSASSSSTPVPAAVFAMGDPFDYSKVPYQSQMMQALLASFTYPPANVAGSTSTYYGAIAIAQSGLGWVSTQQATTQAGENQTALAGCAIMSGMPCALLASGNTFALNSTDLDQSFTNTLSPATSLTTNSNPFGPIDATALQNYNALTVSKAIAVSVDGWYEISGVGSNAASSAEAARVVMEHCELQAIITPCFLFASGDTIVFNPAQLNRSPTIDYTRTTVQTNIPMMSDAQFASTEQNYLSLIPAQQVSIYLNYLGGGGVGNSPSAATAQANALASCQADPTPGQTCFPYSLNLNILFSAADITAKIQWPEVHCNAVPRTSCADHTAMGCTATGQYYVMSGGVPTLANCN